MKTRTLVLVLVIAASLPLLVAAAMVGGTWAASPGDPPTRVVTFLECLEEEVVAATGLTNTTAALENLTRDDPVKLTVIESRCQSFVEAQERQNAILARDIDEFYAAREAQIGALSDFLFMAALTVGFGVLAAAGAWVLAPAEREKPEE